MADQRITNSSLARIAGNIASAMVNADMDIGALNWIAHQSVRLARQIVAELEQPTDAEPDEPTDTQPRKDTTT